MCTDCGCGTDHVKIDNGTTTVLQAVHDEAHEHTHIAPDGTVTRHRHHAHVHSHPHDHDHDHAHDHAHGAVPHSTQEGVLQGTRRLKIEQDVLAKNNAYARQNRAVFEAQSVLALNLVSSPGSGKTTLLVQTIAALQTRNAKLKLAVIEGDQATSHDAERIRATGAPAIQINTGKGCHLDAHMVAHALKELNLEQGALQGGLLFIENVGNLVCPAAFDLGEAHKVAILSVTEGEDKPLKYPDMFAAASLMIINKVDLLPYVSFDVEKALVYARRVNPGIQCLQTSATQADGLNTWLDWLAHEQSQRHAAHIATLQARIHQLEQLAHSQAWAT